MQEQGAPLAVRVLTASLVTGVLLAALFSQPTLRTTRPVLAAGCLAGLLLTAAATRYADPLRVDVELPTPAGALPTSRTRLAAADLAAPAVTFATGALLAVPLTALLGLRPWAQTPLLAAVAVLLSAAAVAVGALSATANNPSPFLTPGAMVAIRLRGLIAAVALMVLLALLLHPAAHRGGASSPRDGLALALLAVTDTALLAMAAGLGARAVPRAS